MAESGSDACATFECDPCGFHGSVADADKYCSTCNDYLCTRCHKTHGGMKLTRDHNVVPVSNLLSTVSTPYSTAKPGPAISVDSRRINSCVFLPNGKLVAVDATNANLIIFDNNFVARSVVQLKAFPWDIAVLNDREVYVTHPYKKTVQHVRLEPQGAVVKKFITDRMCYGIAINNILLYITMHDDPGNGEILIYSTSGTKIRNLGIDDNGVSRFIAPFFLRISPAADRLYISDANLGTVTCLNRQGHVLFEVSNQDLRTPRGVYVDNQGNALVCGADSDNVHLIRYDGVYQGIVVSQNVLGSQYPRCLTYRESDKALVVGCKHPPLMVRFTM